MLSPPSASRPPPGTPTMPKQRGPGRPEVEAEVIEDIAPLTAESTIPEVKAFIAEVTRGMIEGRIKPGMGRELGNLAAKAISAIRTEAGLDEMRELRDLVARAEAALAERKGIEAAARYGQAGAGQYAKHPVTDETDGKPS